MLNLSGGGAVGVDVVVDCGAVAGRAAFCTGVVFLFCSAVV